MSKPRVTIYTDGACSGNPGPGGWGVVLIYDEHEKELSGGEAATTNNRMELMAAIEALEALKQTCEVTIYTDSTYVRKGITEWMPSWEKKGWKNSKGQPVKNQDLWMRLKTAAVPHSITWKWVKGHAGNTYNERVDRLAVEAINRVK